MNSQNDITRIFPIDIQQGIGSRISQQTSIANLMTILRFENDSSSTENVIVHILFYESVSLLGQIEIFPRGIRHRFDKFERFAVSSPGVTSLDFGVSLEQNQFPRFLIRQTPYWLQSLPIDWNSVIHNDLLEATIEIQYYLVFAKRIEILSNEQSPIMNNIEKRQLPKTVDHISILHTATMGRIQKRINEDRTIGHSIAGTQSSDQDLVGREICFEVDSVIWVFVQFFAIGVDEIGSTVIVNLAIRTIRFKFSFNELRYQSGRSFTVCLKIRLWFSHYLRYLVLSKRPNDSSPLTHPNLISNNRSHTKNKPISSFTPKKYLLPPPSINPPYISPKSARPKQPHLFFITVHYSQHIMSFQNTIGQDGSININVIPSFGHIINIAETDKNKVVYEVDQWRQKKGALHAMPKDFDPSRYASFSVREVVEEPVNSEHIHEYAEKSRLSRRLGF